MKVFYFVYPVNHWHELFDHQLERITRAGLPWPNVVMSDSMRETACLAEVWSYAQSVPDDHVLYVHTKGVSKNPRNLCVEDWREMMEYFVIDRWFEAVAKLADGFTCVGCNWHETPFKHFSGNFWWATTNYLATLPKPFEYKRRTAHPSADEMWIAEGKDLKPFCLHESGINGYEERYPREKYLPNDYRQRPLP